MPSTQGRVLSAFFVGYLLTQVLGGRLADRFGGKIVLGIGVLSWSLFTLITPFAAFGRLYGVVGSRASAWVSAKASRSRRSTACSGAGCRKRRASRGDRRRVLRDSARQRVRVARNAVDRRSLGLALGVLFVRRGRRGVVVVLAPERRARIPVRIRTSATHERAELDAIVVAEESRPPTLRELLSCAPVWAIIVGHFCNELGRLRAARVDADVHHERSRRRLRIGRTLLGDPVVVFVPVPERRGLVTDRLIKRGWDVTTRAQDDADDRLRRRRDDADVRRLHPRRAAGDRVDVGRQHHRRVRGGRLRRESSRHRAASRRRGDGPFQYRRHDSRHHRRVRQRPDSAS